jgi:K+-sensing histidine kinase KdpD
MMSAKMQREKRPESLPLLQKADFTVGVLASGVAAGAACAIAAGHSWQTAVPLVFSLVLLVIALLFGVRAGVIGTVLAALVFAAFLFSPLGSIRVSNEAARANLGWMLLIGMGFSFLFAPPRSGFRDR